MYESACTKELVEDLTWVYIPDDATATTRMGEARVRSEKRSIRVFSYIFRRSNHGQSLSVGASSGTGGSASRTMKE